VLDKIRLDKENILEITKRNVFIKLIKDMPQKSQIILVVILILILSLSVMNYGTKNKKKKKQKK